MQTFVFNVLFEVVAECAELCNSNACHQLSDSQFMISE